MRIDSLFSVSCCGQGENFKEEYQAYYWLYLHIRKHHLALFNKICTYGKKCAESQIGCGYDGRWNKASHRFRVAWITHALKIKEPLNSRKD